MTGVTKVTGVTGASLTGASCAPPACRHYRDLKATVYLDGVPEGLADELPGLYCSLFSTVDWFLVDGQTTDGACVTEDPRHVVLFRRSGGSLSVVNRAFACRPAEANRICRALFRALPDVGSIYLDIMFPPRELGFPTLVFDGLERMVIDLPDSVAEYYGSLGKATRRNVRRYQNVLRRAFPDVTTEVVKPGEHSRELVERLAEWKIARFRKKGRVTYWEAKPWYFDEVTNLLARCGEARITSISGSPAAIDICFRVGDTAYVYESANAPEYDRFDIGFLTLYWLACSAIESGARHLNVLEGTEQVKVLLGARPARATRVWVFRSRLSQLRAIDVLLRVLRHRMTTQVQRLRHTVREQAGRYPAGEALVQTLKRRRLKRWAAQRRNGDEG